MPLQLPATHLFSIPEDVIYLDGNSLGPLPKSALKRIEKTVHEEWGEMLITAWNRAGWMDMPRQLGDRIGRLIGAEKGRINGQPTKLVSTLKM